MKILTSQSKYSCILLRILTSILFKVLTSIPKNIVLESYKWSKNFTYVYKRWHIYKSDLGNNLRRLIINSLIKKTIYNNLFPQSFLRVYRTRESGWNFNPHKLFTTKLDLAYSNKNVRQIVLRCIENDLSWVYLRILLRQLVLSQKHVIRIGTFCMIAWMISRKPLDDNYATNLNIYNMKCNNLNKVTQS